MKYIKSFFINIFALIPIFSHGQFTNVSATTATNFGGNKDGGVAWADFNNDGCLDLIFNTTDNTTTTRSRVLFSDCSLPNPSFTDVTASHANGLRLRELERSISVGDYNNDGYIDFARCTHNRFEVFLNKGPLAIPAYSFGNATQNPNLTITAIPGGMNVEGFGWMDYNNDGWLDLIIENHNYGIDIYENPADGTAEFFHVTPNVTPRGLPTGGTTGDYMTLCDYDDDGDIDILARKQGGFDLWTNTGAGTFVVNPSFNENAANANKGGVLFCDFDNDGDFDIFWTDQGVNRIFEQTGVNSGNFLELVEPETSSGVIPSGNIDGCSCGDVDNDGDMDLFLGANSGTSFLYLNDGAMNFTRNNLGINPAGNTEGSSFGDYDNDGDLDLYINVDGGNQLWRNATNNTDYLKVHVLRDLGGGVFRDDLNATAVLKDCDGNILSGIRQVSSVKGHGSNDPSVIHFGLADGNAAAYLLEVRFTTVAGTRLILDTAIVPSFIPNQTMTVITPTVGASLFDGCLFVLPIELLNFNATVNGNHVDLTWQTASEINNDYFTIERSVNAVDWEELKIIDGAGNSSDLLNYGTTDVRPYTDLSYYRLKQTDFDGLYSYSDIRSVNFEANIINIYPNPAFNKITIEGSKLELNELEMCNALGQNITQLIDINTISESKIVMDLSFLSAGIYYLKTKTTMHKVYKQ